MTARVLWVIVVPILSMMPLGADPPPEQVAADLDRKVQSLVARLDADTRKERIGAQRELIGLGPRILPLLPPLDLSPSISAREALREIRIYLERTKAVASAEPSRVTLQATRSLAELAREISRQTGNAIDLSALPEEVKRAESSVDYLDKPFWSVMDDLASKFALQFDTGGADGRLRLMPETKQRRNFEVVMEDSGSVRVSLLSSELRPAFFRGATHLMRARLAVTIEPRLRPLFLKYSGEDLIASTLSGQPLEPVSPEAQLELSFPRGGKRLQVQADFIAPLDPVFSRASLSGDFIVHTAAGAESIAFDDLSESQGAARRRGGVTVTLRKVTFPARGEEQRRATVEVAVSYDTGGPAFESHRAWVYQNEVYLETTDGRQHGGSCLRPLDSQRTNRQTPPDDRDPHQSSDEQISRPAEYQIEQQADGAVVVTYAFDDVTADPGQYRFVYVAPTLMIDIPVKFEFSDFPVTK